MYTRIETLLTNLAGVCIAGAVFVTLAGFPSTSYANVNENIAPTTRAAVIALYVGGDKAQAAVTRDVCTGDAFIDTYDAGDALTGNDAREYRLMRDALNVSYDASEGSDNAVETVRNDYCAHIGER